MSRSALVPTPGRSSTASLLRLRTGADGFQIFFIGGGGPAVLDARAAQAVTMGDFDDVDAGVVQRPGDRDHLLGRELVRRPSACRREVWYRRFASV